MRKARLTAVLSVILSLALLAGLLLQSGCGPKAQAPLQLGGNIPNKPADGGSADTVLVKFKPGLPTATEEKKAEKEGPIVETLGRVDVYEVKVAPDEVSETIESFKKDPSVDFAEPNRIRAALATPNDTYYNRQWGYPMIHGPEGWDTETGQTDAVTVAVIDTGVDLTHPDLQSKVVAGYDVINKDNDPRDDHGHGTHVAGIAAATTNNSLGVAGTSWGAKVMPVKVLNRSGYGTDATVSEGIIWAADHGAKVINMSLGGSGFSQTMQDATDYANRKGVVVLAAAGNSGDSTISYPAGNTGVVGVAALDSTGARAWFSTYNRSVDISAPGVYVLSTYYNGSHVYAYLSGTSMATPFAAGSAALIRSKFPTLSSAEVSSRLTSLAVDIGPTGRDDYYGYGRIDLERYVTGQTYQVSFSKDRDTVTYPAKLTATGQVTPTAGGVRVVLKRRYVGSRTWTTLPSATTDSTGAFSSTISVWRNAWISATSSNTDTMYVRVRYRSAAAKRAAYKRAPLRR